MIWRIWTSFLAVGTVAFTLQACNQNTAVLACALASDGVTVTDIFASKKDAKLASAAQVVACNAASQIGAAVIPAPVGTVTP
jgi:hypothetical protein